MRRGRVLPVFDSMHIVYLRYAQYIQHRRGFIPTKMWMTAGQNAHFHIINTPYYCYYYFINWNRWS